MKKTSRWFGIVVTALICAAALAVGIPQSPLHANPSHVATVVSAAPANPAGTPQLANSYRFERGGWIYVHLEGTPAEIGYQHGFLLAPEIKDALAAYRLDATHETKRDWNFFRATAHNVLWPHVEPEYREEMQGIVEGLHAKGVDADLDDIVALNAFMEVTGYYVPWLNSRTHARNAPHLTSPGNCSAFVATGSYTKGGGIVIAHNTWTDYWEGERWRIIFDVKPKNGVRMLMDGFPGVIASDDDFGVNASGIMITETTISQFKGFDPNGVPEFVRARKALQYSTSIDDYVRIMLDGNNGGYANDWLLGDRKTGEVAQFELGLKDHQVWRTKDGYYVGSNFPRDPKLIKDETNFDPSFKAGSANARRARWEQIMQASKGKIDVPSAEKFLGDHEDVILGKDSADERTLCGHTDASSRGVSQWDWPAYFPGGAVQGKAMDSHMAESLSFFAHTGHPCGEDFLAEPFLKAHPEFDWQRPILRDMKAGPWTEFHAGDKESK
ncbi:MAG TPA: C45 family peptidase [Candidatus Acidoferrum sp.]|nr:C45 family peptidase [Candidatus Acidoferrum sp.]